MAELQGVIPLSSSLQDFVPVVRAFMRDQAELNRLIAGEESSNRFIAWAVLDAVSRFNGTPYFTCLSLDDLFSLQQHYLLLRMTVETVLESVGLLQTRNHLNYSSGGLNVGVNDKTGLIQSWLQLYSSRNDQMITRTKVALNIAQITGPSHVGVHSELWAVNQSYLSY